MGDQNTILSETEARHLLRKSGFGVTPKDLKKARIVGVTRGEAADKITNYKPKRLKPRGDDLQTVHDKWVKFLIKGKSSFQSKLAYFWHDHFATAISTVQDGRRMADQITLLQDLAGGDMRTFVKAINKNPAMMEFLDTVRNNKEIPNENYARELCELFTLGVFDEAGNENYAQEDVVQIARAFTGWRYDDKEVAFLRENRHDYMAEFPERGPKVLFDNVHGFGPGGADFAANGEGEAEIDTVVDILFQHTDTDAMNTVARRTARRLLEFFAHGEPDVATIDQVVAASGFDTNFNVAGLCREIFVHDAFYETASLPPFGSSTKKSVKHPIDFVVSTLRLLRMKPKGKELRIEGGTFNTLFNHVSNMGQTLVNPPSVFGWNWEVSWLSSATLLARYNFTRDIASARDGGGRFKPEKIMDISLTNADDIVDAVTDVLGITDQLTTPERDALYDYLTDNGANTSLNLFDYDTRVVKLNGLFALAMQSPTYQVH